MLENLPYFTVKDIKVYHKSTEMSDMLGREVEEKEFVMDVRLKREYARGSIVNAEGEWERKTGICRGRSDYITMTIPGYPHLAILIT